MDHVVAHAGSVHGSYDNADSHELLRVLRDRLAAKRSRGPNPWSDAERKDFQEQHLKALLLPGRADPNFMDAQGQVSMHAGALGAHRHQQAASYQAAAFLVRNKQATR